MTARTSQRRGSITIEFAVSLPIVLVILVAVLEWGWLLEREVALVQVARDAAHAGARAHHDADPEGVAQARASAGLTRAGFDAGDATVTAALGDSDAGQVIEVAVVMPYEALVGMVPTPANLAAETTMRMEDQ